MNLEFEFCHIKGPPESPGQELLLSPEIEINSFREDIDNNYKAGLHAYKVYISSKIKTYLDK